MADAQPYEKGTYEVIEKDCLKQFRQLGYLQSSMDTESAPLTAFRTKYGMFELRDLLSGLTNSAAA